MTTAPPPEQQPPAPVNPTTLPQAILAEALRSTPSIATGLYIFWSVLQARLDSIEEKIDGGADGGLVGQISEVDARVSNLSDEVQAMRVDIVRLQTRQDDAHPGK